MQAVFVQPATPKQSGSAQSVSPSPSSSMPLLHSSTWWFANADNVTVTAPSWRLAVGLDDQDVVAGAAVRECDLTAGAAGEDAAVLAGVALQTWPGRGEQAKAVASGLRDRTTSRPPASGSGEADGLVAGCRCARAGRMVAVGSAGGIERRPCGLAPLITSAPTLRSATHWFCAQLGAVWQARSWQSMRPLPSSSMPLLQISIAVDGARSTACTIVSPCVPTCDSTTTQ